MKYILGLETSCDETCAAILTPDLRIMSNIVSSQIGIHREFGGVVPEIAARNHVTDIDKVVRAAIEAAGVHFSNIGSVAATSHPGLPGAVMIGRIFGESLANVLGIGCVGVNHILGHIASVFLKDKDDMREVALMPHLALVVSGGHTSLYKVTKAGKVSLIEETSDDAIGEAFDKVARLMDLPYPGGPEISRVATEWKVSNDEGQLISFVANPNYAREGFSYSGLKTAVSNFLNRERQRGNIINVGKVATSFEVEAVNQISYKVLRHLKSTRTKTLAVSGGVSANKHLREVLLSECEKIGVNVVFPDMKLTGDNAAMIAGAALLRLKLVGEI